MVNDNLEFSVSSEWAKFSRESPWATFVFEDATDAEGRTYVRKVGTKIVYRLSGKGEDVNYNCEGCGAGIMAIDVAHPIHDGPFALSGSGRVHRETVPYCPTCEEKPSPHGSPISVR